MNADRRVFYLGLNMPGAVSAGSYTAGVLDFLIDALDRLYEKRREQQEKFGDDFSKWEIPAHEVRLVVMSGASAGGMNAAIAAATLCEPFTPVTGPEAEVSNRLYKAWVEDVDISHLLQSRDLAGGASVVSLLDSTQIDRIASEAIRVNSPLAAKRAYVAESLRIVLTVTNLGGIPYAIETGNGNTETQTLYHADHAAFELRWDGTPAHGEALTLSPRSPANWPRLAEVAKATGSFPIALAPRYLMRMTTEYNRRLWKISSANPKIVNGHCQCESFEAMPPNWCEPDGIPFRTLNVDGGVTNNDPFECARQELLEQQPRPSSSHNPRSAEYADRAVISIAPFISTPTYDINTPPSPDLVSVMGAMLDTLLNQSRIQGENIQLTKNPKVYSRWAISPSIDQTARTALASAALGAFGGFLQRKFRDHDYQLGRRNCQRFLTAHFGLPEDNVIMRQYPVTEQMRKDFGVTLDDGTRGIALIPVMKPLQQEIPELNPKIPQDVLPPIIDATAERLKLVSSRLLFGGNRSCFHELIFKAGWLALQGRLKNTLATQLGYNLARQNLIE